jgi:two-component system chemotaxis response regulator CheB
MSEIRVLLVEDSATMRHHLRQSLAADPAMHIVGEALDGGQAVEMCGRCGRTWSPWT